MAGAGLDGPNVVRDGAAKVVSSGRIDAIQVLRALAAAMVVFGHLIGNARQHPDMFGALPAFRYAGGAGVDIFFLISGFIMVQSSGRLFGSVAGTFEFLRRRLIRIVPLYWLATLAVLALMQGHGPAAGIRAIAASLAFIPYDTAGRGDGMAFPLLDLGWTLNYEMLFYLVFALCLPLARGRCVAAVGTVLAIMVLLGNLVPPHQIALHFWTRPITLEFVAGMGLALMVASLRPTLPVAVRLALVVAAAALYWADPYGLFLMKTTPNELIRLMGWGVPAMLLLIAAITGPAALDNALGRAVVALGDASYALYLLHPFVITVLIKIAQHSAMFASIGGWGFIALGLVVALGMALVVHRAIEAPVTRFLLARHRRFAPVGLANPI